MDRFYSQSTRVTYLSGIHTSMPTDAQPITEERYIAVLATPVEGKVVGHDAGGLPILIDPPTEQLVALARGWRDQEINRLQWLRDRHNDEQEAGLNTTLSTEQFTKLLAYIQALRDWPQAQDFPDDSSRPKMPTDLE